MATFWMPDIYDVGVTEIGVGLGGPMSQKSHQIQNCAQRGGSLRIRRINVVYTHQKALK